VQWLSNNSWIEGTGSGMGTDPGNPPSVTFGNQATTLAGTSANLGTFAYTPPGDGVYQSYSLALNLNLLNDIAYDSLASLHFTAADIKSAISLMPIVCCQSSAIRYHGEFVARTRAGRYLVVRKRSGGNSRDCAKKQMGWLIPRGFVPGFVIHDESRGDGRRSTGDRPIKGMSRG